MSTAQRFRDARKKAGFTQVGLAQAAGCDPSTVSRIERGEVQPTLDVTASIARACKCKVADLIADVADEPEPAHSDNAA